MKILVEPSAHHLQNVGDVAMLTVTVERMQALWPNATVGVLTESPEALSAHCPAAVPVSAYGRQLWFDLPYAGDAVHRRLPTSLARRLRESERGLRHRRPQAAAHAIRARRALKRLGSADLDDFLSWLFGADAVVVVGAGLLTDAFGTAAVTVLELLETALDRGAPAAMFGQGVGPLTDPDLAGWCRRVLPRLDLIALRERRAGVPLLRTLGVDSSTVVTTGDDAIELALRVRRPEKRGDGLGVSLRRARYSAVDDRLLAGVAGVLRSAAEDHGAPLVPVPISRYHNERDAQVIAAALGLEEAEAAEPTSPEAVIREIQRCRVVVTGSYHAGVFALAQGIPAVGLARSGYYVDKFLGLSEQFGGSCPVVRLDDPAYEQELSDTIEGLWKRADELAPKLITAAQEQVASSWAAYRRFQALAESKGAIRHTRVASEPSDPVMIPRLHSLGESVRRRAGLLNSRRRFNCQDQDRPSWDERAAAAAGLLGSFPVDVETGVLQIADLGCGNERLRRFLTERLDQPFDYFGYDLQPQSDRVERLDVQKAMPARVFDAVFCLGLLEYVAEPDLFARRLSKVCRIAIVSYVVADSPGSLPASERRKRGWLTNLAKAELESIFAASGFVQKGFAVLEGGATGLWLWAAGDPRSLDHR